MEQTVDAGGFLDDGHFTSALADRFDDYFTFLNTRVSLVLIETTDFDTAYTIFEILNNANAPVQTQRFVVLLASGALRKSRRLKCTGHRQNSGHECNHARKSSR